MLNASAAAELPTTFAISRYTRPATTSTRPTRKEMIWAELVAMLTHHERWAEKDGWGWSPATYAPGKTRANDNVEAVSLFVADRDHASMEDLEAIRAHLRASGLAFIIYSTYNNSLPDDCRYRIVLPLAKPVAGDATMAAFARWALVWRRATHHVLLGQNDPQTKDLSRFFYPPSAPADVAVFAEAGDGLALDWEALPPVSQAERRAAGSGQAARGAVDYLGYQTLDFVANGAEPGHQRGRALAATRAYLSAGHSVEDTASKVWQGLQNSPCGDPADPWTYEHALAFAEDLSCREAPPLESRESIQLLPPAATSAAAKVSAKTTGVLAETRIAFHTAREVAAVTPEETDWIAPPWVAKGGVTEVDGKIKQAGKTTWALALCRKVLDGEPFMGEPTRKTGIVYLTEQGPRSFRAALARAGLLDRDDFVAVFWHEAAGIPWPEVVRQSAAKAGELGYELLAVDTLGQFAGITGDGENNAGAAMEAMMPLQLAAAEGLAVVIARHERKSGGEVGDSGRGSSAFAGAVDIVLSLRRGEGNCPPNVRVIRALSRFDETPPELVIEYADGEYRAIGTAQDVKTEQARVKILEALPGTEGDAVPLKDLCESTDVPRATAQLVINEFLGSGQVSRVGAGKSRDPFRYWRAAEFVSANPRGEVLADRNGQAEPPPEFVSARTPILGVAESNGSGGLGICAVRCP